MPGCRPNPLGDHSLDQLSFSRSGRPAHQILVFVGTEGMRVATNYSLGPSIWQLIYPLAARNFIAPSLEPRRYMLERILSY
jgi:hypothetical protein